MSVHSNQAAANERPELRVARERRSAATPHQAALRTCLLPVTLRAVRAVSCQRRVLQP